MAGGGDVKCNTVDPGVIGWREGVPLCTGISALISCLWSLFCPSVSPFVASIPHQQRVEIWRTGVFDDAVDEYCGLLRELSMN